MIARLALMLVLMTVLPATAQQSVRIPLEQGGRTTARSPAHRPVSTERARPSRFSTAAAVPGRTTLAWRGCCATRLRRAHRRQLLRAQSHRCLWPQLADPGGGGGAGARYRRRRGLARRADLCRSGAHRFHGFTPRRRRRVAAHADPTSGRRAAGRTRGDPGLSRLRPGREHGPAPARRGSPAMFALGALDDWTPASQCQAVDDRVVRGRELIETHVYEGRAPQLRRARPAGALSRGRRQPQQARRLLRRALRRQRGGVEGVRGRREGVSGAESATLGGGEKVRRIEKCRCHRHRRLLTGVRR